MQDYDANSKWLIQQPGDSILRLAGARGIRSWVAVQSEPVHPRRLPDGMIEVRRRGKPRPILYVLEVSAYPYARLARQALDDALLVYLVRGIVPEAVTLVLRPRGRKSAPPSWSSAARRGRPASGSRGRSSSCGRCRRWSYWPLGTSA